jgi:hypothetical protein
VDQETLTTTVGICPKGRVLQLGAASGAAQPLVDAYARRIYAPRSVWARAKDDRRLHGVGGELYEILREKFGHAIGEKFSAWFVTGVETPPFAHVLLLLTGEGKRLAIKSQNLRQALAAPDCR